MGTSSSHIITSDTQQDTDADSVIQRSASFHNVKTGTGDTLPSMRNRPEAKQSFWRTTSDSQLYKLLLVSTPHEGRRLRPPSGHDENKRRSLRLPYESDTPMLYLMESLKEEIWSSGDIQQRKAAFVHVIDSALEVVGED